MNIPLDLAPFDKVGSAAREYFLHNALSWAMLGQIGVIGLALWLAHRATAAMRSGLYRREERGPELEDPYGLIPFLRVMEPMFAMIFIWIACRTAHHLDCAREGLNAGLIILIALVFIRLFNSQMKNRFWARILTVYIWFWAMLTIFHIMDPWDNYLRQVDFQLGKAQVSLLAIYRAFFLLFILYWLSRNLLIIWRFWLRTRSGWTAAVQILLYKLGGVLLFCASGVLVLHYLGLDLTVFALFSGALGLGLGFGLQKVFANLISGFILLADKSIKPGDVIELKDTYGRINFLGSRYVSVLTRNGTEHLIPNENLVTGEVINWSYSQDLVRLNIPIGIAYGADLEKARDLIVETATVTPRVLKDPQPAGLLTGFGESSVNLELQVWINDPKNGIDNLKSDLLWGIWQRFRAQGIEIPFPQRDVHIKSMPAERLQTKAGDG